MPARLRTQRGSKPIPLKSAERAFLVQWFQEGMTVIEVHAQCLDHEFPAPSEQTLYNILHSREVQEVLQARQETDRNYRLASFEARTRDRQILYDRVVGLMAARAKHYAEAPGEDTGLVVQTDLKVIAERELPIYKTDTALIQTFLAILDAQEDAEDRIRRNLRATRREERLDEVHATKMQEHAAAVEAREKANALAHARTTPRFTDIIVERLPSPEYDPDEEEIRAIPSIPWPLRDQIEREAERKRLDVLSVSPRLPATPPT